MPEGDIVVGPAPRPRRPYRPVTPRALGELGADIAGSFAEQGPAPPPSAPALVAVAGPPAVRCRRALTTQDVREREAELGQAVEQ